MSSVQILELSQHKLAIAEDGFVISGIFLILLVIVSLVFIFQRKKITEFKTLMGYILSMAIFFTIFISCLITGVNAYILSNKLKKDSNDMVILTTSGKIDDDYSKEKTRFIVINNKSFIYVSHLMKANISVGEKYSIKYFQNSGLIAEMKKISED